MEVIKAKDLSKTFRVKQKEKGMKGSIQSVFRPQIAEVRAVDGVSFAVEEGEILAFIGPNGAGKSTTIKMLTGILYPDGGMVEVLGINPTKKRKQLAYEIGTVFGQKEQIWTHLTPYDNFRIRCEIVAAFIHKPKILFLDEPTIGLDPVVKENVRSLIKQMNRELHTTIFLTSHDIGDIEKLCKRIVIVNAGQIVLDDSMDHLKYHYLNKKVVEMKLQEKTPLPSVQGITVLKENGYRLKLEIDTAKIKINEALRYIDTEQVEDINISNIPLENIIMEIYKSEGRAQAAL